MMFNNIYKKVLFSLVLCVIFGIGFATLKKHSFKHGKSSNINESSVDILGLRHVIDLNDDTLKKIILKAKRVRGNDNEILLYDPDIEFFLNSGDRFCLSANTGFINIISNEFSIFGNVIGSFQTYTIKTDQIDYDPIIRCLKSNSSVYLLNKNFNIRSDSLIYSLKNNVLEFVGNVNSVFKSTF